MARGRRAIETDTTPGKVLALALLANAPILLAVVLIPLVTKDPTAGRALKPYILWGVPPLVAASIWFYTRAAPERRQHRAARIGVILDVVAVLLWLLVLVAPR